MIASIAPQNTGGFYYAPTVSWTTDNKALIPAPMSFTSSPYQLSRRNLPDFVKCELVLPFEAELKAEAKKRQGQRNDLRNIWPNLAECSALKNSRDELAAIAGVSHGSLDAGSYYYAAGLCTERGDRNNDHTNRFSTGISRRSNPPI